MPELPEVETTLRGIAPHLKGETVLKMIVRNPSLRWPVPEELPDRVVGRKIEQVSRRGKYLLLQIGGGHILIHLGMSGRLKLVTETCELQKHDHLDILLGNNKTLRFTDPRRFGCVLWLTGDPLSHKLLAGMGPEPLQDSFTAGYLYRLSRNRKIAVKQFLMDSKVVVGVGNIYANEALYRAGIRPTTAAGKISLSRYRRLTLEVKQVLEAAIKQGGTTLRDFVNGEGKPGYFQQELYVYGRGGLPCLSCNGVLKEIRMGQRTTVYCPQCQT